MLCGTILIWATSYLRSIRQRNAFRCMPIQFAGFFGKGNFPAGRSGLGSGEFPQTP
ncbi:MAG: hypothetical protein JWN34_4752 [Bryobacterales bacterium]|jgi:hypothetical protein|nr:hypothetical protein [Bryobacterales bacterium]